MVVVLGVGRRQSEPSDVTAVGVREEPGPRARTHWHSHPRQPTPRPRPSSTNSLPRFSITDQRYTPHHHHASPRHPLPARRPSIRTAPATMSAPSLAPMIMKRPWLQRWVQPLSNWYCNAAGYRQLGLRADDLLPEENDVVQNALKRLRPQEAYDRVFRLRRAFQVRPPATRLHCTLPLHCICNSPSLTPTAVHVPPASAQGGVDQARPGALPPPPPPPPPANTPRTSPTSSPSSRRSRPRWPSARTSSPWSSPRGRRLLTRQCTYAFATMVSGPR